MIALSLYAASMWSGAKDRSRLPKTLSKGERWFCAEQAAVSAGWRKAKV
jgi:hypothetical protein